MQRKKKNGPLETGFADDAIDKRGNAGNKFPVLRWIGCDAVICSTEPNFKSMCSVQKSMEISVSCLLDYGSIFIL